MKENIVTIVNESDLHRVTNKKFIVLNDDKDNLSIKIAGRTYDLSVLYNKLKLQDIRLFLHYDLINNDSDIKSSLPLRKEIILENCSFDEEYIEEQISLSVKVTTHKDSGSIKLGDFIVKNHNTLIPLGDDTLFEVYTSNLQGYLKRTSEHSQNQKHIKETEEIIREKYFLNGMLKLYSDAVFNEIRLNSDEKLSSKASAMCSYIAIRDNLNNYFKRNNIPFAVSNPNVFIINSANSEVEHDALVINKNYCSSINSQYFFDKEAVEAVIEIKTGGFFSSKDKDLNSYFKKYVNHEKVEDIKYIYFSVSESFSVKKSSRNYYTSLFSTLSNIENAYGIFAGINKGSKTMVIPYEYDLEALLADIFPKAGSQDKY